MVSVNAQRRRIALVGLIAAVVVGVILVAALARAAAPKTDGSPVPAQTERHNRAVARRDAAHLLDVARLPAGAARSPTEPNGDGGLLAEPAARPAGAKLVDEHAFWIVTVPLESVVSFVHMHPPPGSRPNGSGVSRGPGVRSNASVAFTFKRRLTGIASRALTVQLVALGPDLTGIRVDAQDVWLVPRASSERVPDGVRTLKIARSEQSTQGPETVGFAFTLTITDRGQVEQIRRWIDALPIVQPGVRSCPAERSGHPRVRFAFLSAGEKPLAVAAQATNVREPTGRCEAMKFAVRGRAQPALLNGASFLARVDRLLHLHLAGSGSGVH